ncbi:hypothetical protein BU17DRAFT_42983 [Hysterangium stoloniferum]|nr:hypothetical protein BU17DRAFT_42983 [Hysterangium stoloniferum]
MIATTLGLQHESLWLEDGNVVILIEEVMFKVHRSILKRSSPLFAAQFANSEFELYDTTPLIRLKDGIASHSDVEALLHHLYHEKPLTTESSFERIAQIIRACTQHDFPEIKQLALRRLADIYPLRPEPFECSRWQNLLEASQLALDCRLRAACQLPALIYGIITTLDFDVEEGLPPEQLPADYIPRNKLHDLCGQVMRRMMDHFSPILFTVPTGSHMECTEIFAEHWMPLAIQPAIEGGGVYKPLETLKTVQAIDWRALGVCGDCYVEKRQEWEGEADEIWSRMHDWIDLDTFLAT